MVHDEKNCMCGTFYCVRGMYLHFQRFVLLMMIIIIMINRMKSTCDMQNICLEDFRIFVAPGSLEYFCCCRDPLSKDMWNLVKKDSLVDMGIFLFFLTSRYWNKVEYFSVRIVHVLHWINYTGWSRDILHAFHVLETTVAKRKATRNAIRPRIAKTIRNGTS